MLQLIKFLALSNNSSYIQKYYKTEIDELLSKFSYENLLKQINETAAKEEAIFVNKFASHKYKKDELH